MKRTSSAFGHFCEPLPAAAPLDCHALGWDRVTLKAKCASPATFLAGYRYVTGRGGNVSTARKELCAEHARRFCERHGLEAKQ